MTEPEVIVRIIDTEFTIGEVQDFLDTARSIGMPADALVVVKGTGIAPRTEIELCASAAYRGKE